MPFQSGDICRAGGTDIRGGHASSYGRAAIAPRRSASPFQINSSRSPTTWWNKGLLTSGIGPSRTPRDVGVESAFAVKADMTRATFNVGATGKQASIIAGVSNLSSMFRRFNVSCEWGAAQGGDVAAHAKGSDKRKGQGALTRRRSSFGSAVAERRAVSEVAIATPPSPRLRALAAEIAAAALVALLVASAALPALADGGAGGSTNNGAIAGGAGGTGFTGNTGANGGSDGTDFGGGGGGAANGGQVNGGDGGAGGGGGPAGGAGGTAGSPNGQAGPGDGHGFGAGGGGGGFNGNGAGAATISNTAPLIGGNGGAGGSATGPSGGGGGGGGGYGAIVTGAGASSNTGGIAGGERRRRRKHRRRYIAGRRWR
jgi:hypothetical protein